MVVYIEEKRAGKHCKYGRSSIDFQAVKGTKKVIAIRLCQYNTVKVTVMYLTVSMMVCTEGRSVIPSAAALLQLIFGTLPVKKGREKKKKKQVGS